MNNKYIMNNIYKNNIYERYKDLKNSNKIEFDNNDLWKIFEYYSCIKLTEEYGKQFYEYNDIDPNFKEVNKLSQKDTGIDCCDLENTIVQCKLRKKSLTYLECATFFASSTIFSKELNKKIIRWDLIITRNECSLSKELRYRSDLFIDRPYSRNELIKFCDNLILTPPKYPEIKHEFILRDYQLESINLIKENKKNIIINLPTGTGKNLVIIFSFVDNLKYLILVPKIILMEQLYEVIIKHKPELKKEIQLIGDGNNIFNKNILYTICVYNSINIIKDFSEFEKIYIDEAHHINMPEIYYYGEDSLEKESKTYINIIRNLNRYNNNVLLSATIDEDSNFLYYSKDIRSMIDKKYLCDYTINIPIFNDDPTNKNICEYLLKYYRNIIIYCKSQKEGFYINKIMNELQLNSSKYIDCNTSKIERNIIINKYKNGDIPFLVNVRLLVEGFDSCITKGICFLHLPKSKISLIQIIGRALRLDKNKTIANIILPCSVLEDETNILDFLKILSRNDSRIRKSYINKILNGYITIDYDITEKINPSILFKYEMIYNGIGILQNRTDIWNYTLNELTKYIDCNNKIPQYNDSKFLHMWITRQKQNYINKKDILSKIEIRNIWLEFVNKYKLYYSNETIWNCKLEEVKLYINTHNILPHHINSKILYNWIKTQKKNYEYEEKIMKKIQVYKAWEQFVDEYKNYFISDKDIWLIKFDKLKNFIDNNIKLDNINNKDLFKWSKCQHIKYINIVGVMKNQQIRIIWENFYDKYTNYFKSRENIWYIKLEEVKNYIDNKDIKPHRVNSKLLHGWIIHQQNNYNYKKNIMKNQEIYYSWEIFIKKYKKYFRNNEDINNIE